MLKFSLEVKDIYSDAKDFADQAKKPFITAHLLLAIFSVECRAQSFLREKKVSEDKILDSWKSLGENPVEPSETIIVLFKKASDIATRFGAVNVNSLHLLMAMTRVTSSTAYKALETSGVSPQNLRTEATVVLTDPRMYKAKDSSFRKSDQPDINDEKIIRTDSIKTQTVDPDELEDRGKQTEQEEISLDKEETDEFDTGDKASSILNKAERVQKETGKIIPEKKKDFPADMASEKRPGEIHFKFTIDPDEYPLLSSMGNNLTLFAEQGKIDPVIGRDREIYQIIDILNKRKSNNPCLIGEPGVGKTAIVEGLAREIVLNEERVGDLRGKIIIRINVGDLIAGTHLRGTFADRLKKLKDEVKKASGAVIIFIDEIHTIIGAGVGDGNLDAANDLKASLAAGEFPCIGATTIKEFKKYIQSDPALERRFQAVVVLEPSVQETVNIIRGIISDYEKYHGIKYLDDSIIAAVNLSARYITDRCLPDKAINLIDLAGSLAKREGKTSVSSEDIARVVSNNINVPVDRLIVQDLDRILRMEEFIKSHIVGHRDAIKRICGIIHRNYAGFNSRRPIGSFIFLGPAGVGKSEIVSVLADFLFNDRDAVQRIDMSEFIESHSVSKLLGPPPGYVGWEQGGQLTEAMFKRPFQVILLANIEKAHKDILGILFQILEEGHITDSKGKKVDFRNSIIIMTSSIGSDNFHRFRIGAGIGFGLSAGIPDEKKEMPVNEKRTREIEDSVLAEAKKFFLSELWNRIEEKIVFHPLAENDLIDVAHMMINESSRFLEKEKGIIYSATDDLVKWLLSKGGISKDTGTRPLRSLIQTKVETRLAEGILRNEIHRGDRIIMDISGDEILAKKNQ